MFKYISEILKQFSPSQKMLALIVLLISIVSVTYINYITKTPDDLTKTISLQRQQMVKDQNKIFDLTQKINDLNDTIMANNQSCIENSIVKEKYYGQKLLEQQKYVTKKIEEIQGLLSNTPKHLEMPQIPKTDSIEKHTIIDNEAQENIKLVGKKLNQIKNKVND